ncbi:MAG TPA: hypothetical protein VG937_12695 [Polyangiaceae bacterium]|nr:hypothetical protein [Polyangiaceae bacterium]
MRTVTDSKRTARRLRRAECRRARGAAMVEAAIVISMLTLGLMGLMFFKGLYLKELSAMRLARASALAYSMTGCQENVQVPKDWLGKKDLATLTSRNPDQNKQPATGKDQNEAAKSNGNDNGFASSALGKTGVLSDDGKGVLNPIVTTDLSGKVSLDKKELVQKKTVFKSDVRSRSWVSCGEKQREGNVGETLSLIKDDLGKLL